MRRTILCIDTIILGIMSVLLCDCNGNKNIVNVDNVDLIELNEENSDIKIVPIRCDFPMDDIYRSIGYDDYTFLLSMSWKKIYCVKKDTVVSVLDASGRGRGEYSYINDFTYSEKEGVLYVQGNGKLLKYSVPSMSFIDSFDFNITTTGMMAFDSELLVKGSYIGENKEIHSGVFIISSATGEIIQNCCVFDYINTQWFMNQDLTRTEKILFPVNSADNSKIMCFDYDKGSIRELYSFSYNSRWRLPRRLIKLAEKDPLSFSKKNENNSLHCEGCHYPYIDNSNLVFWSFPRDNDEVMCVATIIKDNIPVQRSFVISGTMLTPSPYYIHNNYCVDIVSLSEVADADLDKVSPFGLKLIDILKSQPFENPVLLYFTVDKGL